MRMETLMALIAPFWAYALVALALYIAVVVVHRVYLSPLANSPAQNWLLPRSCTSFITISFARGNTHF
jgi:hypothetical protein